MADPPLFPRGKRGILWTRILGKRKSTGCKDRKAALLRARDMERIAANPLHAAANQTTVSRAAFDMLAAARARGVAPGTLKMYTTKAGHLIRLLGADTSLATIDADKVDGYINQRREEGAGSYTISKDLCALRQTLKVARRAGRYQRTLEEVMPSEFATEYEPRRRWLTEAEVEKLCAELSPERAARIRYALGLGCRMSEVLRACEGDIDWERRIARVHGTKTHKSDDDVPILPEMERHLRIALRDAKPESGLLFPSRWPSNWRDMERACKRAGIPLPTWNDLRRTAGTWLRRRGVAPHLIGRFLRHGSSVMAERVYARLDAEGLGALLSPPAKKVRRAS